MTLETYSDAKQLGTLDVADFTFDFTTELAARATGTTISDATLWIDPKEDLTLTPDPDVQTPPWPNINGALVSIRVSTPLKSKAYELWCQATFSDGSKETKRPILIGGQKREPPA